MLQTYQIINRRVRERGIARVNMRRKSIYGLSTKPDSRPTVPPEQDKDSCLAQEKFQTAASNKI